MPRKGWSNSGGPRWVVANHSRTVTSSGEVASRQGSVHTRAEASTTVAHRQPLSKNQTLQSEDRPRRSTSEVRAVASTKILRIQAAIASLGADDMRGPVWKPAALSRAQRLLASRQAHRRCVSFHCTGEETQCSRVCKDRASREAEAGLRGGVGTCFDERPRRHKQVDQEVADRSRRPRYSFGSRIVTHS